MTHGRYTREERLSDPRSTEELIRLALAEEDADAAWDFVVFLQFRGSAEVFSRAQELCGSDDPRARKLGVDILGQLGVPDRALPEECFQTLAKLLPNEHNPEVLESVGVAFGHLHDPRAVELLAPLAQHPDADVRLGVVHGISRQRDALAITTLIDLSRDEDEDVRDWATFGLGSMVDTDTPAIRAALLARVTDPNDDARGEALVGLARRKDLRVLEPLIDELTSESIGLLALEAAEELGDSRLGPALLHLKESWVDDEDRHVGRLNRALLSCLPSGNG